MNAKLLAKFCTGKLTLPLLTSSLGLNSLKLTANSPSRSNLKLAFAGSCANPLGSTVPTLECPQNLVPQGNAELWGLGAEIAGVCNQEANAQDSCTAVISSYTFK